jgi:hypothetical protein
MNPHTHDFRDTVRQGEKTGSPFQNDRAFYRRQRQAERASLGMAVRWLAIGAVVLWLAGQAQW